jgi:hypothetical protein
VEALDAGLDLVAISESGTMNSLTEPFVYRKELLATPSPTRLDLRISGAMHAECDLKVRFIGIRALEDAESLSYLDARVEPAFGHTHYFTEPAMRN